MNIHKILPLLLTGALAICSCSSWDDRYESEEISMSADADVIIYSGTAAAYIQQASDLTQMNQLLSSNGIYDDTPDDGQYTFIVCDDSNYDASKITDADAYANLSVADMGINPAKLVDGAGINTRSGKTVWVYESGNKLDDYNITKTVKASNGYIYYVDGMVPVRQSVYEYLLALGDDYSRFRDLVTSYDSLYFDQENSLPIGVSSDGRVVYDSVMVTKNSLMDRYTSEGVATWNMRSESYTTTMFIPSNDLIDNALNAALDSIPLWLHREATDADREKFEEWIVTACFTNERLSVDEVSVGADDIKTVEDYQETTEEGSDQVTYKSIEGSWWRPSVQLVDTDNAITLSNGMAYYCKSFKIPNHVVIYRVKSRFYELWNNMTTTQQSQYFTWTNWKDPLVINDCQGQFDLITSTTSTSVAWPTIYYHELTAVPTQEAIDSGLPCSVEYCGLTWDDDTQTLYEVNLPAGEYYLRMGFKHSLCYSLSIAFNGLELKTDMNMKATGSDYHFDRGAASEVPHYGEEFGIAYPEGFDVDYWQKQNEKAIAYDTDGYTVGIVTLRHSGNFDIKVTSNDMADIYREKIENDESAKTAYEAGTDRTKSNVNQLMMYHWCLRPTHNNY